MHSGGGEGVFGSNDDRACLCRFLKSWRAGGGVGEGGILGIQQRLFRKLSHLFFMEILWLAVLVSLLGCSSSSLRWN